MEKIMTWIKENKWLSIGIGSAVLLLFFPRLLKGRSRRRKSRTNYAPVTRRRKTRLTLERAGKPRKQYTKGGKAKKAWQIKGSIAARRHMARIRKLRA